jgi:hypothetical protein
MKTNFKTWLTEINYIEGNEILLEAAGAAADRKGKLRELEIGQHLNGGKHMESYRAEGKTPSEIHNKLSVDEHGLGYENTETHNKSQELAKKAANQIKNHLSKHGYGNVSRTVWTSQASDHKSETGVDDPNTSADLIVSTSKHHQRSDSLGQKRKEHKIALSIKTGSGSVNYSNPGIKTMSNMAGKDLSTHTINHKKIVDEHLPKVKGDAHDRYKMLRDSQNKEDQIKAAEIKHSSLLLNKNVAHGLRMGLSSKSHDDLHKTIHEAVAPDTHLKHIVSRQITDAKGNEKGHHTYDLHRHVSEYLDHFQGLHVDPNDSSGTVTVHGYHKKTGKKMPVARVSIHAGGRPANASPRASIVLPSEDHKDIKYSEKSEHMEH